MSTSCLQDFEIQKKLGAGSFSSVYKVFRKSDGYEYAMKKVIMTNLGPKEKHNSLNEVRILASINSSYIVGYKDAFFDSQENSLFIILEYVAGGDLQSKINYVRKKGPGYYFDENIIWTYLIHMLKGLNDLHRRGIYHRDIKCANMFLSKDHRHLKLGDLNVAKVVQQSDSLAHTQAGTPYYASPEVWRDQPYDARCDIWSLGCVVYEMTALRPPFVAKDLESLAKKVVKGVYEQIHSRYSKDLQIIIDMCLQVNPKQRLTADQLLNTQEIITRMHLDSTNENMSSLSPSELLSTIYVPKNLKDLKGRLPKAKYHLTTDVSNLGSNNSNNDISVIKQNRVSLGDQLSHSPLIKVPLRPSNSALKRSSSHDMYRECQKIQQNDDVKGIYQLDKVVRIQDKENIIQGGSPRLIKHRSGSQTSNKDGKSQQKLSEIIKAQKQGEVKKFILPPITSNKNLSCYYGEEEISMRKVSKKPTIHNNVSVQDKEPNQQAPLIIKLLKKGGNKASSPKYKSSKKLF